MDFNSRPNSANSFGHVTRPANGQPVNHFYHYGQQSPPGAPYASPPMSTIPPGMPPPMGANSAQIWSQNEYLSQYYSQYYRDYYQRFVRQQQHVTRPPSHVTPRTPLKYGSRRCHARAVFSQHDNRVLIVDNTSAQTRAVRVYCLRDLFVDYLFAKHAPLLRAEQELPFRSRDTCSEWLRTQRESTANLETRLVSRVLEMCLKQTRVKGHDICELLLPHVVDGEALDARFPAPSPALTQARNALRSLLMRGQQSLALSHALNNGLMDHALCLSWLLTTRDDRRQQNDNLMVKSVRRFCATLDPTDPLHVFYSSLLNAILAKTGIKSETTFESFLILLSNEIDLNSIRISPKDDIFPHLLLFVKSLVQTDEDFLLSDDLFDDQFDAILMNECLEFSRFSGQNFSQKLVDAKTRFVSLLFDFGFVSNCLLYCRQLKPFCDQKPVVRTLVQQLESRFNPNVFSDDTTTLGDIRDDSVVSSAQPSPDDTTPDLSSPQQTNSELNSEPLAEPVVYLAEPEVPAVEPVPQLNAAFDFYGQFVAPAPPVDQNHYQDNSEASAQPMDAPNGDTFSFISTAPPMPSLPFDVSSKQISHERAPLEADPRPLQPTTQRTTATSPTTTTSEQSLDDKKSSGLLGKLFGFRPKNQAILPDDTNPTLVFDKTLQRWVDKSAVDQNGAAPPPMAAPPVAPLAGAAPLSRKFEFAGNRHKRYVDVTRMQQ